MNKPLYCFKLDEKTNELITYIITEYTAKTNQFGMTSYRWLTPRINNSDRFFVTYSHKLDKYANNKIFTFDPDPARARILMVDGLQEKIDEHQRLLNSYQAKINILLKIKQ